jgi:hypothetical protein
MNSPKIRMGIPTIKIDRNAPITIETKDIPNKKDRIAVVLWPSQRGHLRFGIL